MVKKPQDSDIHIFLDMDGVISNMDKHLKENGKIKPDGKTDYDALDTKWWASMPVFTGARAFHAELETLGQVRFLTGPIPLVDCFEGKARWISEKFMPEKKRFALTDLIICHSRAKLFLAGPGRILIDDRIENVKDWEAAGGIGVHHTGDFDDTLKRVKDRIEAFRASKKPDAPAPAKKPLKKTPKSSKPR